MTAIEEMSKCWGRYVNPEVPEKTLREILDYVLTATEHKIYQLVYAGPDRQVRRIRLVPRDVSDGSILARLLGKDFHLSINRQTATYLADSARSYENQMKIASYFGVIDELVYSLGRAGGGDLHEQAARCLANLAQSRENHEKMASSFVLDAFVKLLERDGSPGARFQAVRCLTNVAESHGVRVASYSGALDALVNCMGTWGSSELHKKFQKQAIKCLINLASEPENQRKIVLHRRVLESVVRLLRLTETSEVQRQAAMLLTILSTHYQSNMVFIASYSGVLDSLLEILRHNWITTGRLSVQLQAARCLLSLTSAEENLKKICFYPGALDSIVACLDPNNYRIEKVQILTLDCLRRLAGDAENLTEIRSSSSTISGLINIMLHTKTSTGRDLAATCLKEISISEETIASYPGGQYVLKHLATGDQNSESKYSTLMIQQVPYAAGLSNIPQWPINDWSTDPITYERMCDPVKGNDGITYDRWTLIDNKLKKSPYDRSLRTFFISCDDLNVRRQLFLAFPQQITKFRLRRQQYREHALKHSDDDLEDALEELRNVLMWAPSDEECIEEQKRILQFLEGLSSPEEVGSGLLQMRSSGEQGQLLGTLVSHNSGLIPGTAHILATLPALTTLPTLPTPTPAISLTEPNSNIPSIMHDEMIRKTEGRAQTALILVLLYVVLFTIFL